MLRLVLIRTGIGLLTLWAASLIVFLGTQLLPGDAAQAALGQEATPQLVAALRNDLGLNRPIMLRYGEWLVEFVQGDFGLSLPSKEPVANVIGDHIRNTGLLARVG